MVLSKLGCAVRMVVDAIGQTHYRLKYGYFDLSFCVRRKFKTNPKLCLIPSNKFNLFSIFCKSNVSCASLRSTWSLTCLTDCSNVDVRSKISVRVSVTESSRRPMLDSKFSRRTSIVCH